MAPLLAQKYANPLAQDIPAAKDTSPLLVHRVPSESDTRKWEDGFDMLDPTAYQREPRQPLAETGPKSVISGLRLFITDCAIFIIIVITVFPVLLYAMGRARIEEGYLRFQAARRQRNNTVVENKPRSPVTVPARKPFTWTNFFTAISTCPASARGEYRCKASKYLDIAVLILLPFFLIAHSTYVLLFVDETMAAGILIPLVAVLCHSFITDRYDYYQVLAEKQAELETIKTHKQELIHQNKRLVRDCKALRAQDTAWRSVHRDMFTQILDLQCEIRVLKGELSDSEVQNALEEARDREEWVM